MRDIRVALLAGALLLLFPFRSSASFPDPSFLGRHDYPFQCLAAGSLIAAFDADGDGIPDLICSATNQVLLGNGDGSFRNGPIFNIGFSGASVVPMDLNGDGNVDLILVGGKPNDTTSSIGISFGNGDGTFQQAGSYPAGSDSKCYFLAVGDFNGDHILDVATLGQQGMWLFTGKGNGQLNPGVLTPVTKAGNAVFSISAADLNRDGKLDVVASTQTGFTVLLGNGDGTFQPRSDTRDLFNGESAGMTVADLNQDGIPDVILSSYIYNYILVYLGNGNGTFQTPYKVALPNVSHVVVADVDGDGIPDLIGDGINIAFGRGNGTFKTSVLYAVSAWVVGGNYGILVADLLRNGRLDIVTVNLFGSMSVLINKGRGTFKEGNSTPVSGGGAGCTDTADFNGDGLPDLAISVTAGISILLGTGKAFAPFIQGPVIPVTNMGCLIVGDLNRDGIPDLLINNYQPPPSTSGQMIAFLGNGDGTFTQRPGSALLTVGFSTLGDFNGDGILDYALSSNLAALGNGDGTFRTPFQVLPFTPLLGYSAAVASDLNGDGRSDLVYADRNGYVYVVFSTPVGFVQSQEILTGGICSSAYQPFIADVNADGKPDLLFACDDANTPIYLNSGAGVMTYAQTLKSPLISHGSVPVVADLNGDGINDIAVVSLYDVAVYVGTGSGNYESTFIYQGVASNPATLLLMNLHGQSPQAGKPDMVVPDGSGKVITLLNTTK